MVKDDECFMTECGLVSLKTGKRVDGPADPVCMVYNFMKVGQMFLHCGTPYIKLNNYTAINLTNGQMDSMEYVKAYPLIEEVTYQL